MEKSKRLLPWLGSIRFISSLIVVMVHARAFSFPMYKDLISSQHNLLSFCFYYFTRINTVLIFFVMSGFLIGGVSFEKNRKNIFSPSDFAIDRFVRIMLPFFPSLVLTGCISILMENKFDFLVFFGNLMGLQGVFFPKFGGNVSLWTLAYEIWFYVFLYSSLSMIVLDKYKMINAALLIISLSMFLSLSYVYFLCWIIGFVAYITRPKNLSFKALLCYFLFFIFSLALTQVTQESRSVNFGFFLYLPSKEFSMTLFSISIALIFQQIILVKYKNIFIEKIEKCTNYCANFSYSLYLTHYPLMLLLEHYHFFNKGNSINIVNLAMFFFLVVFCLLFAFIFYLCFEKHTYFVTSFIKKKIKSFSTT